VCVNIVYLKMGKQINGFTFFVETKFKLKETVYLRTDITQAPRLVVAIVLVDGPPQYQLNSGTESTTHLDYEISREQNLDLIEYEGEFEDDFQDEDEDE
jgi:hypothetical protein